METNMERLMRNWKRVAIASLLTSGVLLVTLMAVAAYSGLATQFTDERLIGIWQSDVDRTIAYYREMYPVDDVQEGKLRTLFGKMRVTYTPTKFTTELNGSTESYRYEVLGLDKQSVVIREVDHKPSSLDILESSAFIVIHFEGPDVYWLISPTGGNREYFKRAQ